MRQKSRFERSPSTAQFKIGLFFVLLSLFSTSIAACSTAPAEAIEVSSALPLEISVDEAYQMYQEGTFVLDVRTQEEWDDFHAPNTTLIPLDQLESRLDELR